MNSQETFSVILKAVKILICEKIELYKECKFNVLKDTETAYRVIVDFNNCMGEILVINHILHHCWDFHLR